MANNVTRVQGAPSTTSGGGPFPSTLAYTSSVTAGNLLLLWLRDSGNASSATVTDTVGTTWAVAGSVLISGSSMYTLYWGLAGGTGANTVSLASHGSFPEFTIAEYNNPDGSWSVGTPTSGTSFQFSPWLSGPLTNALDDLCIACFANETSTGTPTQWNGPTGFTLQEISGQDAFWLDILSARSIVNQCKVEFGGGTMGWLLCNFTPLGVASNGNPRQRQTNVPVVAHGSGTTATVVLPAAVLSGSQLVVWLGTTGGVSPSTVTDDQGNTYTQRIANASVSGQQFDVWTATSGTTGTPTVTATYASSTTWTAQFSEIQNASSVDTATPVTASGFPGPVSASFTPSGAPALVRSYLFLNQTASISPFIPTGDPFVMQFQEDDARGTDSLPQLMVADLLVNPSASKTLAGTYTGFSRWLVGMLAFDGSPAGPTINTQPSDVTKKPGETATFSVTATTSGGSLTYQWFNDGGSIGGATSSSFTTGSLSLTDNGDHYWCAVTDTNGTVDTRHALLSVKFGRVIVVVMM